MTMKKECLNKPGSYVSPRIRVTHLRIATNLLAGGSGGSGNTTDLDYDDW